MDDSQTGTKFHHSEQRDGDVATGEYDVVLPDGRKQVVEYEAGLQGYKPQIRYEGWFITFGLCLPSAFDTCSLPILFIFIMLVLLF